MTALIDNLQELQKRIECLQGAQTTIQDVRELSLRRGEAEKVLRHVSEAVRGFDVLDANKIRVTKNNANIITAIGYLKRIIERFKEKPETPSLVKGKDWKNLGDIAPQINEGINADTLVSWQSHVDAKFNGETPEQLRTILAPTDNNQDNLEQYEEKFTAFRTIRARLPEDGKEIKQLYALATQLTKLSKKFQRDVPKSVNAFLNGVASGGAKLSLLTEEVVKWLKKNNSYDNYRIH
jgi:hypothetical protein